MPILLQPCESLSLFSSSPALDCFSVARNTIQMKAVAAARCPVPRAPNFNSIYTISSLKTFTIFDNFPVWRTTQTGFCSGNDIVNSFSDTYSPGNVENDGIHGNEDLELLEKPDPVPATNGLAPEVAKSEKTDNDEVLAPFLKYFKPRHTLEELEENEGELGDSDGRSNVENKDEEAKKLDVEYYEPKPGDIVVGVVVSGNENKLDVNVGSDLLGTMLTKEVLPLYDKEMEYLLCDFKKDAEEFMVRGKIGIVKEEDEMRRGQGSGRPVVDIGTVLFAEVLGRTLSGRPLLSTRRLFRRISWHRVRQIKQLNEPIQVKITEWNTGGLLTRIEGLRAFLPKAELVNRVNSFTELKENVGRQLYVQITRINEANNDLILSEKKAWEMLHLQEGTLLEGTVKKIFPYGAQVRIGETNRSGLLHISNISRTRIASVSDILKVDEKVKVLVVKSMFPDKISLSIADLESEPGLFMSNKEKVFSAAEEMAKKYRQKLPTVLTSGKSEPPLTSDLAFDDEASVCANWSWFKFETDNQSS